MASHPIRSNKRTVCAQQKNENKNRRLIVCRCPIDGNLDSCFYSTLQLQFGDVGYVLPVLFKIVTLHPFIVLIKTWYNQTFQRLCFRHAIINEGRETGDLLPNPPSATRLYRNHIIEMLQF